MYRNDKRTLRDGVIKFIILTIYDYVKKKIKK